MKDHAKMLTGSHNWAIVQMPGRNFPGVVFQGDSLFALKKRIKDLARVSHASLDAESRAELQDIVEQLEGILKNYEKILRLNGLQLPYNKSDE